MNVARITPVPIDASALPSRAFGTRSPAWWGNTLLIVIQSTAVALLVASTFVVAGNDSGFPAPDLRVSTANVALLLAGAAGSMRVGGRARKKQRAPAARGLAMLLALGLGAIVLRAYEFRALGFAWHENAYASAVWGLLVLHLLYLGVAAARAGFFAFTLALCELDEELAADVTLTTAYWTWMAGTWVVLYGVVYWGPRVLGP